MFHNGLLQHGYSENKLQAAVRDSGGISHHIGSAQGIVLHSNGMFHANPLNQVHEIVVAQRKPNMVHTGIVKSKRVYDGIGSRKSMHVEAPVHTASITKPVELVPTVTMISSKSGHAGCTIV